MRWMITGAGGQLGHHLVAQLCADSCAADEVTAETDVEGDTDVESEVGTDAAGGAEARAGDESAG